MNARGWALVMLLSAAACRVGGPTVDDSDIGDDAGHDAGGADTSASNEASAPVEGGSGDAGASDALADAGDGGAAHDGASSGDGACVAPAPVTTCDPVCNTGCAALSRCDLTDKPNEGSCIGIWIQGEGSGCLKTSITDPCAPQLSCVNGTCVRLCYHDSDCAGSSAGTCCSKGIDFDAQASGFKQCGACGP